MRVMGRVSNSDNPFKWSDSHRRECDFCSTSSDLSFFLHLFFYFSILALFFSYSLTTSKKIIEEEEEEKISYRAAASFNFWRRASEKKKSKWPLVLFGFWLWMATQSGSSGGTARCSAKKKARHGMKGIREGKKKRKKEFDGPSVLDFVGVSCLCLPSFFLPTSFIFLVKN